MKYKNRVRSRVANLGDSKNPFLKKKVISGTITPKMIAVMSTQVTMVYCSLGKFSLLKIFSAVAYNNDN